MRYFIALVILLSWVGAGAQNAVRFGSEAADTVAINDMLRRGAEARPATPEAAVAFFARQMLGVPYQGGTLEGEPETLTVRLDSVDCTTFVETAMALAFTLREGRSSWRDFVYNLRRIRYRGGEVNGYPSRLHYIADWAVDNRHRGNFKDVSDEMPKVSYVVRTIDFMSRHAERYPALADSANLARIRDIESGYRMHRFPYVKTGDLQNKAVRAELHEGDVLALVSNLRDLDVTHMGIVVLEEGVPYLLHASSSHGRVEVSELPLADFLKRNRQWLGIRIFRLND